MTENFILITATVAGILLILIFDYRIEKLEEKVKTLTEQIQQQ